MPEPTSAQYSLTVRVRLEHRPGRLGRVTTAIGEDYIIPSVFNRDVAPAVAAAVAAEAKAGYAAGEAAVPPSA